MVELSCKLTCMFHSCFQKKRKTHRDLTEEEVNKVPHSFVMHRGEVGKSVLKLEVDIRRVMEPYTATRLKVNTVFCDYIHLVLRTKNC